MNEYAGMMERGRLYAKLNERRHKLEFAQQGIAAMRDFAPRAYASISFGKQSICLAHMLYHVAPTMPMYFLASWETFALYDYEEVIAEFTARWPIRLTIVQTDNVSDNDLTWQESRRKGRRDLQTMCNREEWDGWYWGLVKEESKARRITLSHRWEGQPHPSVFRYTDGKYRCCPLMHWSVLDIAAYVQEHGIRLLDVYQKFGLQMRTTARITGNMAEMGGMAYVRKMGMERLNKIAGRFPEIRSYL